MQPQRRLIFMPGSNHRYLISRLPSRAISYVLSVLLHGQLLNGARDIYWQASILNHDITSSVRKDGERERGDRSDQISNWPHLCCYCWQTHSVHNTPTLCTCRYKLPSLYSISLLCWSNPELRATLLSDINFAISLLSHHIPKSSILSNIKFRTAEQRRDSWSLMRNTVVSISDQESRLRHFSRYNVFPFKSVISVTRHYQDLFIYRCPCCCDSNHLTLVVFCVSNVDSLGIHS
jgi:hypothetical protein